MSNIITFPGASPNYINAEDGPQLIQGDNLRNILKIYDSLKMLRTGMQLSMDVIDKQMDMIGNLTI